MSRQPRIVDQRPNVENTIPLAAYRAHYPARFSLADDDKLVLYGGGENYRLEIVDNSAVQKLHLDPRLHGLSGGAVSVYVLNHCLVIWINGLNTGIEIPYTLVALHALKEINGVTILYLQLLSSDVLRCEATVPTEYTQTVELVIHQEPQPTETAPLPLLAQNDNISDLYNALSTCSALHYDSDSSDAENEQDPFGPGHQWITAESGDQPALEMPTGWLNVGDADDLEAEEASDPGSGGEAGMNVTVVSGQIAGVARRRNSGSSDRQKLRRLQR